MAKERSATATIKGYFYQFDYSILQLLHCKNDTDSVCIEGIEDVDLMTADETTAVQCKYYAGTEYNHSLIAQPLRYMLDHYLAKGGNLDMKYKIYGYYNSGQHKLTTPINKESFRKKFLVLKAFEDLELADEKLIAFLSKLQINIQAEEFDKQEANIFCELKKCFACDNFDAEYYYYNNALKIVKDISTNNDRAHRNITKGEFITKINNKNVLFNRWFLAKKGLMTYCSAIKKEFFTHANLSPIERFFVIEYDNQISDTEIKTLLINIGQKYSKISQRETNSFCPYIHIHNIPDNKLDIVLKKLHSDNVVFIDGYDYKGAEFSTDSICKRATAHNKITLKILYSQETLDMVINRITTTREIYQFHINTPFYNNIDHKHIKILVEQTMHINQII